MVKPASRKGIATHLVSVHRLSERRACWLASISRTAYRYNPIPRTDQALRARLIELAGKHQGLGYEMLHGMLRNEGLVINEKRTYRLYREESLQLRIRKRKKLKRPRQPIMVPIYPNVRWSMDFVSDQLSNGRRFRVLNVKDDYSKELIGQLTAYSISGQQVARFLDQLIDQRAAPDQITCDNGTEFTCKAMFFWQKESGVKLAFIQPGKPTQNAFVESLNGKFRNECLNRHWFRSLDEAKEIIDEWRHHYNHERPHSALNFMPPAVFAARAA